MSTPNLPLGCRFIPLNIEVLYYLTNKILGLELPIDFQEINLYSYNPTELPKDKFKHGKSNNEAFFYTYKKENRTTKDGYWSTATILSDEIFGGDQIFGFKRKFIFFWLLQNERIKTRWIMDEYGINPAIFSDDEHKAIGNKIENYTLCRIHYEPPLPLQL